MDFEERFHGRGTRTGREAAKPAWPSRPTRRGVLALVAFLGTVCAASARVIRGGLPFERSRTQPPVPVDPRGPWAFLSAEEAAAVEAIVDRLIPSDGAGLGGREAGCAVFIDRQLAADYGRSVTWYLAGPVTEGTPQQGPQHADTIADRYRAGLAALDAYCRHWHGDRAFAAIDPTLQDAVLSAMERGEVDLGATDARAFFEQLLGNTRQGYLADPIYGGNRGMAGWRLIGFPGARYDYRSFIGRTGEDLGLEPVSLLDKDI